MDSLYLIKTILIQTPHVLAISMVSIHTLVSAVGNDKEKPLAS